MGIRDDKVEGKSWSKKRCLGEERRGMKMLEGENGTVREVCRKKDDWKSGWIRNAGGKGEWDNERRGKRKKVEEQRG